jgi:restriction endonuclease S subunit
MKATDSYRKINNSPLKGIILYYTEKISKATGETNVGSVIAKIQTGKTPPKATSKYYESNDVNWFKPSDIGYSKYLVDAEDQFSFIAVKEKKATIYPKDTLLMIGIGGGVGRVSILKEEGSSNQQITGLTFKANIFPEYAYYYYLVREDYIKSLAKSMSFPILNQESIKGLKFSYPAIEEQKEFVRFIDNCWESFLANQFPNFDEYQIDIDLKEYSLKQFKSVSLIDRFNKNIENETKLLTQLKQSILKEAIHGKFTAEWRRQNQNIEPASELLTRIKAEREKLIEEKKLKREKPLQPINPEEIPFKIPDNWAWCRLGDIVNISSGDGLTSAQMVEGEIPVYGGNGVNGYHNKYNISEETVTIGRVGAYCGAVHLTPEYAWVTDNCFITSFNKICIYRDYLIWHLKYMDLGKSSYDGAQPVISGKRVYPLLTFIPPYDEQKVIVQKVELLFKKCSLLSEEIATLNKHGKTLLKAMFNETFETNAEIIQE